MDDAAARLQKLKQYLSDDPDNLNLLHDAIDLAFAASGIEEVKALLERANALAATHPRTLFQGAQLSMSQHDFGEAEKTLVILYQDYSDNQGVSYNLALCWVMQGKFQEALPILSELHSSQSRFLQGDHLYLRALHHLGDIDKALLLAEQMVSANPEDPDSLGIYSLLLIDSNQGESAVLYAKKAVELKPTSLEALSTLGSHALEDFDTESAKQYFETALKVQPLDGRSWMGCGLAALIDQDLDLGEACLEKALQHMPTHLGTWNALAWVRIMKGSITGAEQAIDIAMERDRTFSENHGTLAVVQILQGKRDLAKESIRRALGLDKQCFSANFAQVLLLDPLSDQEKIQKRIQTLIRAPIVVGGTTIEKSLQSYMNKRANR